MGMGMEGYSQVKMKRKELEDVNDDFSDFSLSSPARKIRRLDAELLPIMEEDEPDVPLVFSQSVPPEESCGGQGVGGGGSSVVIEELGSLPETNEERAIVLFNPINTPLMNSPSSYSFSVSPNFMSGFKNQVLWSSQSNLLKAVDGEIDEQDDNMGPSNGCLAVVPWVPTHSQPSPALEVEVPQTDVCEMESDEAEAATMEIEDNGLSFNQRRGHEFGGGLNQWQQHCMIQQPPQNLSTPVTWFRRPTATWPLV